MSPGAEEFALPCSWRWLAAAILLVCAFGHAQEIGSPVMTDDLREARLLGTPIRGANLISYKLCPGYGVDGHDLLCWTTTAESGGHFSALDLATDQLDTKPLNHLEAYPIVPASDGSIYVGVTTGQIMRYRADGSIWEPLAQVWSASGGLHHVRVLCEGADGWLYCGSCYGERARVRKETGEVQALPAIPEAGSWYVSSVVPLPDGRVAFGLGHVCRIYIYDPAEGRDVAQWAPPEWTNDGFAITMARGENVLYAFHFPSGRRGAFDIATGRFLGDLPWPSAVALPRWSVWGHSSGYGNSQDFYVVPGGDTIAACDGESVFIWNPQDGPRELPLDRWVAPPGLAEEMRYAVTSDLRVLDYDPLRLKVVNERRYAQPEVKRGLFGMGLGPDGCIYGGAYQSMDLFRYDPRQDELVNLGSHNPTWSGETYSFCLRGNELVSASYTNGAIVLYDPAKPWECTAAAQNNPRFAGCLGQLTYRPLSCVADSKGRVWGVGPAGWGTAGGGVSWLDPATGDQGTTQLGEAPWYVTEIKSGTLLVAGSVLRWWDADRNIEVAQVAWPHGGTADAVLIEVEGRKLLAIADSQGLHLAVLAEPGALTIERTYALPMGVTRLLWDGKMLIVGGDKGIAQLDLVSGQWTRFCSLAPGLRYAFVATDEAVYFTRGTDLYAVPRPGH